MTILRESGNKKNERIKPSQIVPIKILKSRRYILSFLAETYVFHVFLFIRLFS